MKKILGILSIMLACTFLFACSGGNQAQVKLASKKISGGLDKMISQVKKLEDVNTDKMDLTSILGDDMDTSDGYHCYGNECYYCENGNCYKCKNCPRGNSYANSDEVSTARRDVRRNIYPYREILTAKVPTRNHMSQRASVNLFAGSDYRSAKRNLNLSNGNGGYNELRTACNNVCDLNKEYSTTKTSLINNCNTAKQLLERLKNGEAKLSDSDIKTLNSYYEVIKQCTNNISSCKSCKSTVNSIGKKKLNLASNSGSMTADYRNIYNCLDANCNACNNANNSVLDLINFANKLLGEKQDEAMLGTSTGTARYNAARDRFNSSRYQQSNSIANNRNVSSSSTNTVKQQNNKVTSNNYPNGNTYNTSPYTKDIKDAQKYYENRRHNPNIVNGGTTTLLPTEYEKPVANDTTNSSSQNATNNATVNNSNTIVSNHLPSSAGANPNRTSNQNANSKQYGVTYNKNGNSIANNSSTTYHPNALPQTNSNRKNTSNNSYATSQFQNNGKTNTNNVYKNTTNYSNNTYKNTTTQNYSNNSSSNNAYRNNINQNNSNNSYKNNMTQNYSNNAYRNNTNQNNSNSTYRNTATQNYSNSANSNNTYRNNINQSNSSNTYRNNVAQNYSNRNTNQNFYNNQGNSTTYGTGTNFSSSRNNPRVNYYAPAALRTEIENHMSNFAEPFTPRECIKSLSNAPKQVRA